MGSIIVLGTFFISLFVTPPFSDLLYANPTPIALAEVVGHIFSVYGLIKEQETPQTT